MRIEERVKRRKEEQLCAKAIYRCLASSRFFYPVDTCSERDRMIVVPKWSLMAHT